MNMNLHLCGSRWPSCDCKITRLHLWNVLLVLASRKSHNPHPTPPHPRHTYLWQIELLRASSGAMRASPSPRLPSLHPILVNPCHSSSLTLSDPGFRVSVVNNCETYTYLCVGGWGHGGLELDAGFQNESKSDTRVMASLVQALSEPDLKFNCESQLLGTFD